MINNNGARFQCSLTEILLAQLNFAPLAPQLWGEQESILKKLTNQAVKYLAMG